LDTHTKILTDHLCLDNSMNQGEHSAGQIVLFITYITVLQTRFKLSHIWTQFIVVSFNKKPTNKQNHIPPQKKTNPKHTRRSRISQAQIFPIFCNILYILHSHVLCL